MAHSNCTQATPPVQSSQPPKNGIGFLEQVLKNLDCQPLTDALQAYRPTGRPGYPVKAMLRAYLAKFVLAIRYNNQLLDRLRLDPKLRELCGFEDTVPSESALSRFTSRLADHTNLLEPLLTSITNKVRRLAPKTKSHKNKPDESLRPLGEILAIDSTIFTTYANPNRKPAVSDPDAAWGVKHSARAKTKGTEYAFGYKLHMISDAVHGVPLASIITPANRNDSPILKPLLKKALKTFPWLKPKALLADRGYDSEPNHNFVYSLGIIPIIHIRKPTAADGLHNGIYTKDGYPTCLGSKPMQYVRTDPENGHHLFQCQPEGCILKTEPFNGRTHCDTKVSECPTTNTRVLGPLPRFLPLWKQLYRLRMSIERIYRSLKHSRGLEGHCARGLRKITLQVTLSVLTYQATVLAHLQAKDPERMRRMSVKVA